jgi:dihydrofolate reductase
MSRLVYIAITSVDGYVNDERGGFEWAAPDEEVHAFVNDLMRPAGTHLLGRRLYETMAVWDDPAIADGEPAPVADFAELWRAADKVVYSGTLDRVWTASTTLERRFDPSAIATMKEQAIADLTIGGPTLAGGAIAAGLVDEYHQLFVPEVVGGGTRWLPEHVRVRLQLVDEHRFGNGTVHVHYRTAS